MPPDGSDRRGNFVARRRSENCRIWLNEISRPLTHAVEGLNQVVRARRFGARVFRNPERQVRSEIFAPGQTILG